MVPSIKRCARCYTPISWEDSSDWYSHIRIKYCDECRAIINREQAAERLKRYKQRKKEADRIRDARLKELELENRILRDQLKAIALDEPDNERTGNYADNSNRTGDI